MPSAPLTILLALLSVVVPLTLEPSTAVLVVLWTLTGISAVWTVVTIPAVSGRFWQEVANRVAARLPAPEPPQAEPMPAQSKLEGVQISAKYVQFRLRLLRKLEEELREVHKATRLAILNGNPDQYRFSTVEWERAKGTIAGEVQWATLYDTLQSTYGRLADYEAAAPEKGHPDGFSKAMETTVLPMLDKALEAVRLEIDRMTK